MNEERLDATEEFDTYLISKFPAIEHPVKLISDFNTTLNQYAQQSTEHGEVINSITVLLSSSDLETWAAGTLSSDGGKTEEEARRVIYGSGDLAGLREKVNTLPLMAK